MKVRFVFAGHHFIRVAIKTAKQEATTIDFSDVVQDGLLLLVSGLVVFSAQIRGTDAATIMTEPGFYDFTYSVINGNQSELEILYRDESGASESVVVIAGSKSRVLMPFWRGLRLFYEQWDGEHSENWNYLFPKRELQILEKNLKTHPGQQGS